MNHPSSTSSFRRVACLLAILVTSAIGQADPVDLRCENHHDPLAVIAAPGLSWRFESKERSQRQTAWRILVASSAENLAEDRGDLWDSGKVETTREPSVTYGGSALEPGMVCHWKVRCWDALGNESGWSKPAKWEVSPMAPNDWHGASWIDDGRENPENEADFYQPDPAPLMRREFAITKPILRARLHVTGLGLCLPSINGQRLEDHVLDPPWTHFDKRILFRTHDITNLLTKGDNCLGLTLGNGWYNPLPLRMWGRRNIREALPIGRPRAIACLVAEHPDGTRTIISTGPDWSVADGPTTRNSLYLGEERDARLSIPGWDKPGFDASKWRPVRVAEAPLDPLQPLAMPPVRSMAKIPAKAVTSPAAGIYIVDFGQNFTGVPESELQAPAGTRITFRYGELLNADGTLNPLTSVCGQIKGKRKEADGTEVSVGGPGAPEIAWQQDVLITRGGSPERYRPDFTYHGFRFMEITGLPAAPSAASFVGIPLHTDLPDAGAFECSNPLLNQIQQATRRTFLANVVSVQSDCPHRERFAYGGDIVATSEAFMMNFDMADFYAKTVRDWADAARPDGRFTDTAPFVGVDYCGVGWSMVHPLLLEQLHVHYGNRRLIEEQIPAAIRWLEGEASRRKDGLVTTGLGDHEALAGARGPALTTAMFVDAARRVARLARLTGREKEAARCDALANESASAWAKSFLDPATGKVAAGTQTDHTFALGFGAAAPGARPAIFRHLVADLTAPDDGPRLSTGIYGTRILLEELSQHGRSNLAYALAKRETFPSWGWMLKNDATTLWEHWAGGDNTYSHNHPMFGSISAWFFRWLGGIQAADDAIGFDRILIRPQVVEGLDWVKCSHRSIRGPIQSNWSTHDKGTDFEIFIPPDTTAIIELPKTKSGKLTESGKSITDNPDISSLPSSPSLHRLQVGSGHYRFASK